MTTTRSATADNQRLNESNLPWYCLYCNRRTTFAPDRLVTLPCNTEPQLGLVILNEGVICCQCRHELDEADD